MATKSVLINKISDFLENRQKSNNFGTCKRCLKNVYWSTTKIASHIRSGHCSGSSEEEIQRFKNEFVYDSPKNLVHKSAIGKTEKPSSKEGCMQIISLKKEDTGSRHSVKRAKLEITDSEEHLMDEQNETSEIIYEMENGNCDDNTEDEKVEEIYFMTESPSFEKAKSSRSSLTNKTNDPIDVPASANKEEKFIAVVYPQFKGRSKMQLIDEILDLKRRNELLQIKVKTYENTINKLI